MLKQVQHDDYEAVLNRPLADVRRLKQIAAMTAYEEVDLVIDAWAHATVKKLFTEWADQPARFVYLPGLRPFECFQIAIARPLAVVLPYRLDLSIPMMKASSASVGREQLKRFPFSSKRQPPRSSSG